ncbi:hypothetical protein F4823DRAFT_411611 [Ustulina deusta]|nr:hypothetical protein F4823DRAFT_411611 [Ustulina deusta]
MHISTLNALFVAIQAVWVYALPPKVQAVDGLEPASFTPTEPISGWPAATPWTSTTTINGWPHSPSPSTSSCTSYFTTKATQVVTATTITVTDNSITWTPTQSISGWPPSGSKTQTAPGQQLTETFTITYTSHSEETIIVPSPSFVTVTPSFTFVTVTVSPTSLASPSTGQPWFTIITMTATATPLQSSPATPRFTTVTVSEVTVWPTPTTTPSSTQTSQLVTLTFASSSVNESLNSTTVSYSSTVMTLSPPPTFATGTATVGFVGKRHA